MEPGVPPPLSSPTHLNQRRTALLLFVSRSLNEPNINRDIIYASRAGWFSLRPSLASSSTEAAVHTTAPSSVSPAKPSTISTGQLQTLLPFHLPPIKLVVSQRSYGLLGLGYLIL